jgi:hypothetical protein
MDRATFSSGKVSSCVVSLTPADSSASAAAT